MTDINTILTKGVEEVIVMSSLEKKLNGSKKLIVKLGIDPTGSELHLGHAVVLRKLREFQDLGHQAVLVIGDFTAKIGDPSGRTKERKSITNKQIEENMTSYLEQASKVIDVKKVRLANNSEWLSKMGMEGVFELASKVTIAQIMERKEFRDRLKNNIDVPYLEMLYPLMQGYDSVHLKADVELGGTDQKFNLLMGRQIQKRYDQTEQDVITVKLLTGTDGNKMSKSADNYISLKASPSEMYGKIMSISDEMIPEYWNLCTYLPKEDLTKEEHPMKLKKILAKEIVNIYHGIEQAELAEKNFEQVFQKGNFVENVLIETLLEKKPRTSIEYVINSGATTSTSQAKDLIKNKGLVINNKIFVPKSWDEQIEYPVGTAIYVGKKRIIKII